MIRLCCGLLAATWALLPAPSQADLWMPSVFGSGMVIQRDKPVAVWGEADAGATIEVSFAGQSQSTTAGADGAWSLKLEPLAANAEPQSLTVKAGDDSKTFDDVLIGEVWVASGQSNMQWSVSAALEAELEIATANFPEIRLYYVPRFAAGREMKKDIDASWTHCTPETTGGFSAVAYYFGRTMHKALGVPVGLINTSWGGTRAEAWTPEAALRAVPELAPIMDTWDERDGAFDEAKATAAYEKQLASWKEKHEAWKKKQAEGIASAGQAPRRPQRPQSPIKSQHHYSALWNGMVDAIAPFTARGAIWYQGESNAGRAYQYRTLMKTLIESWRDQWSDESLAFYQVQLAYYDTAWSSRKDAPLPTEPVESAWAELREAQTMVANQLDNAGTAVTTDIGAAKDIHPKDKQNVGKRLARMALVDLHGFNIARSGPVLKSSTFDNGKATLKFETPGGGGMKNLTTVYRQPLRGFAIAGEDRVWHNADCKLLGGNTVVCSHPDVQTPVAVRYNWDDTPEGTLINQAYLPAEPFRTDDWDGVTKNNVTP